MTKKKPAQYIVEREFLCKFSVEELLIRIVKSHIKNAYQEGKTFENHGKKPYFIVWYYYRYGSWIGGKMIYQKGSNLFNVAIYIRLSREDGDKEESDSVGNQRKLLTEYVNKHDDFILYDVYIDDGFTGTNFAEVR